jgi:hypothetical protein
MARKVVLFVLFYFIWIFAIIGGLAPLLDSAKLSPSGGSSQASLVGFGIMITASAPIFIFLLFFFRTPKWEKEVQETGKIAPAQVIDLRSTGVGTGSRYNPTMYYRLELQVQPPGEEPFKAVLEKPLDAFGAARPGAIIQVKYDPNNKHHVVIPKETMSIASYTPTGRRPVVITAQGGNASQDLMQFVEAAMSQVEQQASSLGRGADNSAGVAQQLMNLSEMHKRGELTDSEFEAAKKKLLA